MEKGEATGEEQKTEPGLCRSREEEEEENKGPGGKFFIAIQLEPQNPDDQTSKSTKFNPENT